MKAIFIIILFALSLSAFAQEGKDTVTYIYCEMAAVAKYGSAAGKPFNVNLFFDFGNGLVYDEDKPLKDKNGKAIEFESDVDAMNYLSGLGWKLQTSAAFFMAGSSGRWVTHHYFKKPKYLAK